MTPLYLPLSPILWGSPGSSVSKKSACSWGDLDLIPGLGRSPGGEGMATDFSCVLLFLMHPRGTVGFSVCSALYSLEQLGRTSSFFHEELDTCYRYFFVGSICCSVQPNMFFGTKENASIATYSINAVSCVYFIFWGEYAL